MADQDMKSLQASSYISGGSAAYLEDLYERFLQDPTSVDVVWRDYFQSLPEDGQSMRDVSHAEIKQRFIDLAKKPTQAQVVSGDIAHTIKQGKVEALIKAFRRFGHLSANIDPLGSARKPVAQLALSHFGLSQADMSSKFQAQELMNEAESTLADIYQTLQQTYCGTVGVEYTYITNEEEVKWLQQRIEKSHNHPQLSAEQKLMVLQKLVAAEGLEQYLGTRYVGQKRFSLEGGDSFIPLLHELVQHSGAQGTKEVVIGMAHRGRLNVLLNIMGQTPEELFQEFEGTKDYGLTSGDVKYHLGFSSDVQTKGGPVHLSLAFNPSHLEVIGPVVMGSVRCRQDKRNGEANSSVLPILVHGDAAFAGQGVVMEEMSMSQTDAYHVGGTIHIVINNQIGFTTSKPKDARSSEYCTGIAKMIEVPVFHVNGDDPEAMIFIAQLAVEYRKTFGKSIVIDLCCYRRQGHNEADEPAATQPQMYKVIRALATTKTQYAEKLIAEKIITQQDVQKLDDDYMKRLDSGLQVIETLKEGLANTNAANWTPFLAQDWNVIVDTAVAEKTLKTLAKKMTTLPNELTMQRQVGHLMQMRVKMAAGEQPMDWGFAENLAYASLLSDGYSVRMTGQDCQRGTFAHRHAVLHNIDNDSEVTPLKSFAKKGHRFEIYNSLLSEYAVLGFEYGYSSTCPQSLVLWEAQFGDFANGAQVVVDQFISSAWQKWKRLSGLVMLLPHGYEGMGPEHSSARLERYLQLCAQHNMEVCVPSTPAQMFHLLRRQMLRPLRKPLIVMTPKSLLRHKRAVSTYNDLSAGKFQLIIPDEANAKAADIKQVVLCSGKIYYELLAKKEEDKRKDVAIIRIEQLYPFPHDEVKAELKRYKNAKKIVWCQEEPHNQGAWYSTRHNFQEALQNGQELFYAGRDYSAAPAAGYKELHDRLQKQLVEDAFK